MGTNTNGQAYDQLIRLVRIARGLERGGIYNAAKLFWAAAFSEEIRASNLQGVPIEPDALDREMEGAITTLKTSGVAAQLLAALEHGRVGAKENRTIPRSEIPELYVCRDCGEILLGESPQRCPSCGARSQTFREFPPVYYLEPLRPEQALLALRTAPDEIERAIEGLTEEQMAQVPAPGRWAIRDVLSHLLVAQSLLAGRAEKMLTEDNPSLQGVAAWTIGRDETLSAKDILALFRASREATVARLQGLALSDWFRMGEHEEFGQVTLLQQASQFAKHERYHLPRMESTRRIVEPWASARLRAGG